MCLPLFCLHIVCEGALILMLFRREIWGYHTAEKALLLRKTNKQNPHKGTERQVWFL